MSDDHHSRSRPKLFRALGSNEPPQEITIKETVYRLLEIIKHDSWAATALYASEKGKVVCKFNRIQSIFGFPMQWLGRLLARREREMYLRLAHLKSIPNGYESIFCDGEILKNAAAHQYIDGTPLRWHHRLEKNFFEELSNAVAELHHQRIAVVDLNKKENIIVGDDQRPYLIDFQISVRIPHFFLFNPLLNILQRADRYHLEKHLSSLRPDLLPGYADQRYEIKRPIWIRLHRKFAIPFRQLRRRLLVSLQVRNGDGKVHSEQFVESGLRHIAVNGDPLLALYELLVSTDYFESTRNKTINFVDQLFLDLYDRAADDHDQGLIKVLENGRSREEIVMQLLRSPSLFAHSNCLSDEWLIGKLRAIKERLFAKQMNHCKPVTKAA